MWWHDWLEKQTSFPVARIYEVLGKVMLVPWFFSSLSPASWFSLSGLCCAQTIQNAEAALPGTIPTDMGSEETWAWADGWFSEVIAGGDHVDPAPTWRLTPWFYWAFLITMCPPGVFWTWSWSTDWIPGLTSDLLPHHTTDLDWRSVLAAIPVQICSLDAPCKPPLFPPLIPKGVAGLETQENFICQCEFIYAVPVLPGC